jgi:5-methyltetrahydrofolate--homocysteine methyltransferase
MLEKLKQAIIDGDIDDAGDTVTRLLNDKGDPALIVSEALIPAMDKVAEMWKEGEYFMSDVILCANAFGRSMDLITPALAGKGVKTHGKFLMGVVEGDMHDLGKNIVAAMLRANGFEVIDLGVDQPTERFVEAVRKEKPDILGIGAYMATTSPLLKEVIDAVEAAGLRKNLNIVVGGVCVTPAVAENCGADAWGGDAMHTVNLAKEYLGVK